MDRVIDSRESFGQYLEAAGPGPHAEQARQLLGAEQLAALGKRWSGTLLTAAVTADDVRQVLGVPDRQTKGSLGYALSQRPGYLYTFVFDLSRGNHLSSSGFERIEPRPIFGVNRHATSSQEVVLSLMDAGATMSEAKAHLGEPLRVYGWWPVEILEYSDGLELTFRHRILERCTNTR